MTQPSKFELVMAAIQKIQTQLDEMDGRLQRIEQSASRPATPPKPPGNLDRQNETLSREDRRRRFDED